MFGFSELINLILIIKLSFNISILNDIALRGKTLVISIEKTLKSAQGRNLPCVQDRIDGKIFK